MLEVIWHARGGQGAFTAARALGAAASLDARKYALAFPTFGPERRGAPMRAYTKMSSAPIGNRSAVSQGDIVVYLDDTLFAQGWEAEVAEGGTVLVNSKSSFDDPRVVAIDASGLSANILGRSIPNTVFLGVIAAVCEAVTLEDVCEGIRQTMPAKLHDRNIEVVKAAYDLVRQGDTPNVSFSNLTGDGPDVRSANNLSVETIGSGHFVSPAGEPGGTAPTAASVDDAQLELRSAGACARAMNEKRAPARDTNVAHGCAPEESAIRPVASGSDPTRIIPRLQSFTAQPTEYARTTCFEGGLLTSKNAGWRSARPVIDHGACTMCLTCYMACPDGTIYKCYAEGDGGEDNAKPAAIAIDYDFCKGCGVCAQVCPAHCISMVEEGEDAEPGATEPASANAKEVAA